jgi:hypothetical protein
MKRRMHLLSIMLILIVALTACSKKAVPTAIVSVTFTPSITSNPSKTPFPSGTPNPPPRATATATAIPNTPLPPTQPAEIDPGQVKLYTQGFLPRFNYFFVFEFPKEIKGEYHAVVDINKDYTCDTYPKHPERLYCWGPLVRLLDYTQVALYASGMSEPLFDGKVFIPDFGQ